MLLAPGLGGRVEVDLAQRKAGAVQEVLAAQLLPLSGGVRVAVTDGAVELDRLSPAVRIVVAYPPPTRVAVERASYCEYSVTVAPGERFNGLMSQPKTGVDRVEVPNLVGLTVPLARRGGHDSGLVVIGPDLDGPPLGALTWPGTWVVTAQDPKPGHSLRRGAMVTITFEKYPDDGGAGDREPRRPLPQPQARQAERDPRQQDEQEQAPH